MSFQLSGRSSPPLFATPSCPPGPPRRCRCPGVTTSLGPAAAVQGRKSAVKCLGARTSFWRKALARRGRGRHARAYLHMLLFHFHTLHANALWKVPSRFPPGRREGGRGWAGMEGSSLAGSASPWGIASTSLPLPAESGPTGGGPGPSARALGKPTTRSAGALWRVLGRMLVLCSSLPRGSSGQALGSRASCLYSSQPRGGTPESSNRCPTSPSTFQVRAA